MNELSEMDLDSEHISSAFWEVMTTATVPNLALPKDTPITEDYITTAHSQSQHLVKQSYTPLFLFKAYCEAFYSFLDIQGSQVTSLSQLFWV